MYSPPYIRLIATLASTVAVHKKSEPLVSKNLSGKCKPSRCRGDIRVQEITPRRRASSSSASSDEVSKSIKKRRKNLWERFG